MTTNADTYTGKPCSKCGNTTKQTIDRSCVTCAPEYRAAWRNARADGYDGDPCTVCDTTRRRKNGNCVECQRQYDRKRREENPEAERLRSRVWQKNNLDKALTNNRLRKGRMLAADGRHTSEDVGLIWSLQDGKCSYCDHDAEHLDHVIPLSRGGSNWPWNLQWLCAFHNVSKLAMTDAEYRHKQNLPADTPISWKLWMCVVGV